MDKITMNKKERNQLRIFGQIKAKTMIQRQAARELGVSPRQIRRKYKRWLQQGDRGLIHLNRGVPSKQKWSGEAEAIDLLKKPCYAGFGPTFAAEKLEELHKIKVSVETLRKAMVRADLWTARRSRPKHRRWRESREHFGMLIQMDGSDHAWFEGRGPKCIAYNSVDDATSEVPLLLFVPAESTKDIMRFMKDYIERYGRPEGVYVDCHGAWRVNKNNPDGELITQLERAMGELDIKVTHAKSPQAKGRVENKNGVLQDRLVKELRLENISTVDAANKFIQDVFLPSFNKKFTRRTDKTKDMHRSAEGFDLERIFSIQTERVVQNDFTILYERRVLQIERDNRVIVRPKNVVKVHERLDGSLELFLRDVRLNFKNVAFRERKKLSPVDYVNQNKNTLEEDDEMTPESRPHLPFLGNQEASISSGVYGPRLEPTSLL